MAKRMYTSSWEVTFDDDGHKMISFRGECPYCSERYRDFIFTSGDIEGRDFETDYACCLCNKDVVLSFDREDRIY